MRNGPWFIVEFNRYQYRLFSTPDAGHKGFPGYHFVVLLIGCFPASLFCLRAFFKLPRDTHRYQQDFIRWMKILFWVVLILFSIVQSKIVHYSSMCYFPLTFLACLVIRRILNGTISFPNVLKKSLITMGALLAIVLIALPFIVSDTELMLSYFKEPFARAALEAEVKWSMRESVPGLFMLGVVGVVAYLFWRKQNGWGIAILFGGMAIWVNITFFFVVKKVELYSQNAAIEFFKQKVSEECYILPLGYKTYGHLFYANKLPLESLQNDDPEWLLFEKVDRPTYFITKIHQTEFLDQLDKVERISAKNGFVMFRRKGVPSIE